MSFSASAPIIRAPRSVFRLILNYHKKIREEDPSLDSLKDLKSFLEFTTSFCLRVRSKELAFLRWLTAECEKNKVQECNYAY